MPTRRAELDHVGAYNYAIEMGGEIVARFASVSKPGIDPNAYQDGTDLFLKKMSAGDSITQLVMTKGYIVTSDLQDWWRASKAKVSKREIVLILNDNAGNEIRRFRLSSCWPKQWKMAAFDGKGGDAAVEEVVFAFDELKPL